MQFIKIVGIACFVGVNTALFALSSYESDRESKFLDYSLQAAHAGDRYYDACERGEAPEVLSELKMEKKRLEKLADKYW